MVNARRIAIIPARGGSKRIPRKNIIDFAGKPMLAWTVEAGLSTGLFDRVVVSTDDPEIADVARRFGADVPFLREGLADDITPISQVTAAVLDQLSAAGAHYDVVVQLMANCPLRGAGDITAALGAFEASGSPFQISCARFGWLNPWWAFRRDVDGQGRWLHPEGPASRSQDLDPLFCPTGAIWIARTDALLAARSFYGEGQRFEPIDWKSAVDIDDQDDLDFALAVHTLRHARQPA